MELNRFRFCTAFLILGALTACVGDQSSNKHGKESEERSAPRKAADQSASLPWTVTLSGGGQELKLVHSSGSASFSSVEAAIAAINKKYPQIKLQYVGRRGDTVVTRIPEASYLTQEIGTAGAEVYFAEATFSLTEVPAINAVTFNFEEGDHAMPGTYSRKSFEDLK